MTSTLDAESFIQDLTALSSDAEKQKMAKFFKGDDPKNQVLGVRMKDTFDTAKEYTDMPLSEVQKLLDSPYYDVRMGAVSIMDFKTRGKNVTDADRKELYDLYVNKHDRINNWDLVDRSAPRVVGWYLMDKRKDILYHFAKSKDIWERRTAIVATLYFSMQGEVDETYKIAEMLGNDTEELVNKAIGTALRYAGQKDKKRLADFLDVHAKDMSPITLRLAKS